MKCIVIRTLTDTTHFNIGKTTHFILKRSMVSQMVLVLQYDRRVNRVGEL